MCGTCGFGIPCVVSRLRWVGFLKFSYIGMAYGTMASKGPLIEAILDLGSVKLCSSFDDMKNYVSEFCCANHDEHCCTNVPFA